VQADLGRELLAVHARTRSQSLAELRSTCLNIRAAQCQDRRTCRLRSIKQNHAG